MYTSYAVPCVSAATEVLKSTTVSAVVTLTLSESAAARPPGPVPARTSAALGVCRFEPSVYPGWNVRSRVTTT